MNNFKDLYYQSLQALQYDPRFFFSEETNPTNFCGALIFLSFELVLLHEKLTSKTQTGHYPANIYLLKVSNRNTGKRCKICSK